MKKSKLTDVFEQGQEGHAEWQNFMNKEYYENYKKPERTIYEICLVKEQKMNVELVTPKLMDKRKESRRAFFSMQE